ncbi:MAG: transcriptional regulator [Aliifodinibius sp.]|nr:transcriptional regulator [Fodinibius sp.]NIV14044.1 transcriptional regulator [Fodinibius sp.]NIY25340.1 transcriptional regulator [Fodinibius sp.]
MKTTTLKLVTIVTERILEDRLLRKVQELGAKGYTLTQATGKGSRGVRASEWEGPDTRIQSLVSKEVADDIVEYIAENLFEHYAVIVYVQDAEVVRGEKYI